MGGGSRNREACPQLLDLIHKDREWIVGGDEGSFGVAEYKKLELKLGPPGEDWVMNENFNNKNSKERDESPFTLGYFPSMPSKTHNHNNGNNPWLINTNGNQNQNLLSSEKQVGTIFSPQWCSSPSPSPSPSPSAFHTKTQHQPRPSYIQFPSNPQSLPVMAKESSQTCSTKVVVELQDHPEKKVCSLSSVSVSANTAVNNSSQKRTAPAPVVGWPPIRSFRKNLASSSSSKPVPESQNEIPSKEVSRKPESHGKGLFVKINMDGVPIGRKVDLKAYDSYEKLSSAVDELFRGLLAAQKDSSAAGNHNKMVEVEAITGLLDGSGEYTLVYEDNEGDMMLVGDVPWDMFASTVKRLRVLKSSELSALHISSSKQERTSLHSNVK